MQHSIKTYICFTLKLHKLLSKYRFDCSARVPGVTSLCALVIPGACVYNRGVIIVADKFIFSGREKKKKKESR